MVHQLLERRRDDFAGLDTDRRVHDHDGLPDGHVEQVRVTRPSGVPEFDDNVRKAVLRAAPFDRFPKSIPGPSMRLSTTFDMSNPVVK